MRWQLKSLDEIGYFSPGRLRHRPRDAAHLYGGPYPFIQTGDVTHTNLYVTEFSQTYSDAGLAQSNIWKAGTLCITIAANIADTAILGIDACFLLTAILKTARKGKETFQSIFELRGKAEKTALTLGKKANNARSLLNHLYVNPLVTPGDVAKLLNVTHQTASSLIRDFETSNILEKSIKRERSQSYVFTRYFGLFLD